MTIKAYADSRFGSDLSEGHDHNLSRARIAGYVLLAGLLLSSPARAQSYTWVGTTSAYNDPANWSSPVNAPPIFPTRAVI